jgi:hypothetical protein
MTPEERSKLLRKEADKVMAMIHLKRHCNHIGTITPTGSYFLDCMMYPDIDLYVPLVPVDIFLGLAIKLARYECVRAMNFEKGGPQDGDLANGFYLKPRIEHGNWGRLWKIDIWTLPVTVINEKQAMLEEIKKHMTPEHKKIILHYKYSILTEEKRTPMFSGFFIYQAVVNKGIADFTKITHYLRDNGIKV